MAEKRQGARAIQEYVNKQIGGQMWLATGLITEVRKSDRRVRVNIMPDDIETNWIRVFFLLAGPDYMIGALPEVDTEVLVVFMNGNINHAYCIAGGTFFDDDEPPMIANELDLVIRPKYGGWMHITKDDGIIINTDKNVNISVTGKTTILCDDVNLGNNSGSHVLTVDTFLPKYNSDMALLAAHTNLIAPDPTLTPIGNATDAHACTKVKAK